MIDQPNSASFTGRRWQQRAADTGLVGELSVRFELTEVVSRILASRCLDRDEVAAFLLPRLTDSFPDPFRLDGVGVGAQRIVDAIIQGESIALFGDYDVDGITSVAILYLFLCAYGVKPRVWLPKREDGYGPNERSMRILAGEGIRLVIMLDCGTTAHEELALVSELGMEAIVVDHHLPDHDGLPPVEALVNPCLHESGTSPFQGLCTAGLAIVLVTAIRSRLAEHSRIRPNIESMLDLAALGTICDMAPLTKLNRALVWRGLRVLEQGRRPGLVELARRARISRPFTTQDVGFGFGPRLNAAGRMGDPLPAFRLLVEDGEQASVLARHIDDLNKDRRNIEQEVVQHAKIKISRQHEEDKGDFLLACGNDWHRGVLGVVASRLAEHFSLPVLVLSVDSNGMASGSGRSVAGVDLGRAVLAAHQAGILTSGGGHVMACGVKLPAGRVDQLRQFMRDSIIQSGISADEMAPSPGSVVEFDTHLTIGAIDSDLLKDMGRLEPFGIGNPVPRFVLSNVRMLSLRLYPDGGRHCVLKAMDGAEMQANIRASAAKPLPSLLPQLAEEMTAIDVLGRLHQSGRGVRLTVEDIRSG